MSQTQRPLAIVTGASSGIGLELAKQCAEGGYDLLIVADEAAIESAASALRQHGAEVEAVQADLSTIEGVDTLLAAVRGRPVEALLANAGRGLGHAFLDQPFDEVRKIIDTNITGTIYLVQKVGQEMRERNAGKILITGSIAGFAPGSFQAVYNASKAFLNSFSWAIRNELKETKVTVTCLMPGATETEFFDRADMLDTKVGQAKKDDPAMVAKTGYDAMIRGDGDIVAGFKNKIMAAVSNVMPAAVSAQLHRGMSKPADE
ncbi:MAG: oxidoreductase [Rhodospirillales bacterium]|jgi:short-subunit dehydrogenase|nr:oxidoreductase [Rhodospirillales bacterium]